jgi:hypothetical protein
MSFCLLAFNGAVIGMLTRARSVCLLPSKHERELLESTRSAKEEQNMALNIDRLKLKEL